MITPAAFRPKFSAIAMATDATISELIDFEFTKLLIVANSVNYVVSRERGLSVKSVNCDVLKSVS